MKRHELKETQWIRISPLLPPRPKKSAGRHPADNRQIMNGIYYQMNTGIAWPDLPKRFGSWHTVYKWFRIWTQEGIMKQVQIALIELDFNSKLTINVRNTVSQQIAPSAA